MKKYYKSIMIFIMAVSIGLAGIEYVQVSASEDLPENTAEMVETEESDVKYDSDVTKEITVDDDVSSELEEIKLSDEMSEMDEVSSETNTSEEEKDAEESISSVITDSNIIEEMDQDNVLRNEKADNSVLAEESGVDILQDVLVSEESAETLESGSKASVAGIRLDSPVSAIVGKPYEQKLLNILDRAGDTHELHYTCEWFDKDWNREKMEDELPPGLSMSSDGTISGTPTEPGTLYLWFKVTWESNAKSFDTLPDGYSNEYMSAVIISVIDEDDPDNGRVEIGNNPATITVDKDFVLPSNSEKWYKFIAPRNIVLYSKSISQYAGWGKEKSE